VRVKPDITWLVRLGGAWNAIRSPVREVREAAVHKLPVSHDLPKQVRRFVEVDTELPWRLVVVPAPGRLKNEPQPPLLIVVGVDFRLLSAFSRHLYELPNASMGIAELGPVRHCTAEILLHDQPEVVNAVDDRADRDDPSIVQIILERDGIARLV